MTPTRRTPRRDPVLQYHIQSDFAAGLALSQIAEKHALPEHTVAQALRRDRDPQALPDPFSIAQRARNGRDAALLYWVGYVASCGSVYDGAIPTVVLDVDPRDRGHVESVLEDLCGGRLGHEYCSSTTRGLQVYIRDRDLGRLLVRWGLPGDDRSAGSVPIALIPTSLLSHFVRGCLEGARRTPPFGMRTTPVSPASVGKVVFTGPESFIAALREAMEPTVLGTGTFRPPTRNGEATLVYEGRAALRVMRFAYRDAARSIPRADRLRRALQTSGHRARRG